MPSSSTTPPIQRAISQTISSLCIGQWCCPMMCTKCPRGEAPFSRQRPTSFSRWPTLYCRVVFSFKCDPSNISTNIISSTKESLKSSSSRARRRRRWSSFGQTLPSTTPTSSSKMPLLKAKTNAHTRSISIPSESPNISKNSSSHPK